MASTYPGAVDSFTNPAPGDAQNAPEHAGLHAALNDSIEAVEAALGANASGSASTVGARLSAVESSTSGAMTTGGSSTIPAIYGWQSGTTKPSPVPVGSLFAKWQPVPPPWSTVASMTYGRILPGSATVGGKLYVFGGRNSSYANLSSVEVYDPATGIWTPKTSMPSGTSAPMFAAAVGTIIYVLGGSSAVAFRAYDTVADTWTTKTSMSVTHQQTAVVAYGGNVYVIGGVNQTPINNVDMYTPGTNSWTTKTGMPTARSNLVAELASGIIYAIGGYTSAYVNTVEAYDPVADSWSTKTAMPGTAKYGWSGAVVGNVIYMLGGTVAGGIGSSVTAYDTSANSWTAPVQMVNDHSQCAAQAVGGLVYAAGGGSSNTASAVVDVYNPANDSTPWVTVAPMLVARSSFTAVAVGGIIYALGGDPTSKAIESYDPATNVWTSRNAGAHYLYSPMAAIGNVIYMMGGSASSPALYAYDTVAGTTTTKATPASYGGTGLAAVGGFLYSIGGYDANSVVTKNVYKYDPVANSWSSSYSTNSYHTSPLAVVLNGFVYITGGSDENFSASNVVEKLNPVSGQWTSLTSTPSSMSGSPMCALGGNIYVFSADTMWVYAQIYDPVAGTLTPTQSPRVGRSTYAVAATDSAIYVLGGHTYGSSVRMNTVETYSLGRQFLDWEY